MVLVTDHTKPLERLNRGDRVEVPRHLIGSTWYVHTLVEPVPKAVEPLPNLVEPVPNHVYLLHNYQNLREVSTMNVCDKCPGVSDSSTSSL